MRRGALPVKIVRPATGKMGPRLREDDGIGVFPRVFLEV
jgi:hypothetical protein